MTDSERPAFSVQTAIAHTFVKHKTTILSTSVYFTLIFSVSMHELTII